MKRTPLKRVGQLKRISNKRSVQLKLYAKLRQEYLSEHPMCEVCNKAPAGEIHHKRKRYGERLNEVDGFVAICRVCHTWIHENPSKAREQGWLE